MENQSQPTTNKTSPALWVSIILVIIILAVGAYFLFIQEDDTTNTETNTNTVANTNTVTNTNVDTSGWETYENEELGYSFKYPSNYGEVVFSVTDGTTGQKYSGYFSDRDTLRFGGITNDYSFPSEGGFMYTQGYLKENEKYYFLAKTLYTPDRKIEVTPLKEIEAIDSTGIIVEVNEVSIFTLSDAIGGIFNLKEDIFPGIVFQNSDLNIVSQQEFESILSTLTIY